MGRLRCSTWAIGSLILSNVFAYGSPDVSTTRSGSLTCTAAPPAIQSQYNCGARGRIDARRRIFEAPWLYAVDADACRDLIYRYQFLTMEAFSYDETTELCTLYYSSHLKVYAVPNSTTQNWISRCFRCSLPSFSQPIGVNLVGNPGFEDDPVLTGPWLSVYDAHVVSPGHNSAQALLMNDSLGIELYQSFETCKGWLYQLSFDYKVGGPDFVSSEEALTLDLPYSSTVYLRGTKFFLNNTWATYHFPFTHFGGTFFKGAVGASPVLRMFLAPQGQGPLSAKVNRTINNIKLIPIASTLMTSGQEMLINSGFESGSIAPWNSSALGRIVSLGLNNSKFAIKYALKPKNLSSLIPTC